jgi:hypothetical protein
MIKFDEIITEAKITKEGNVKDVKSKIIYGRCDECVEGNHIKCSGTNCACRNNNHKG